MTSISSSIPPQVPQKIKDAIVSTKPGSYDRFKKIDKALSNPTTLKAYELWSRAHPDIISKYPELQVIDRIADGYSQRLRNNDYVSNIIMKAQNIFGDIGGALGFDNTPEINEVNPLIGSNKFINSIADVEEKFLEYDMGIIPLPILVGWLCEYPEWKWMKESPVVAEQMSHIFDKLQFHEIKAILFTDKTYTRELLKVHKPLLEKLQLNEIEELLMPGGTLSRNPHVFFDPLNEVWNIFDAKLGDDLEAKNRFDRPSLPVR
jgi:hypothetical protein